MNKIGDNSNVTAAASSAQVRHSSDTAPHSFGTPSQDANKLRLLLNLQPRMRMASLCSLLTLALLASSVADAQVTLLGDYTEDSQYDFILGATSQSLPAGVYSLSGSLIISNGARFADASSQIGFFSGDPGDPKTETIIGTGSVLVDGTNSLWYNSSGVSGVVVGGYYPGSPGSLTVQNGGQVSSGGLNEIGPASIYGPISGYSTVTVTGPGSLWTINAQTGGELGVGNGQLAIENGGEVLILGGGGGYGRVGLGSDADASTLLVDGSGSKLVLATNSIGCNDKTATSSIIIRNGGWASDNAAYLQQVSALVDGAGSIWSNTFIDLAEGSHGSSILTIQNGAQVYNYDRTWLEAGNFLTVNGSGSALSNLTGNLEMDSSTVVVKDGGTITCGNGLFMLNASTVTVNGAGSSLVCSNSSSVFGRLTVVNGGTISTVASNAVCGAYDGGVLAGNGIVNGNVQLSQGVLAPGDGAGGVGTLTVNGDITSNDRNFYNFSLGASSDKVVVSGNLHLAGTLNITNAAGFGPGTYTLFTYGGVCQMPDGVVTINGPAGFTYLLDTNTAGAVNLTLISNPPNFGAGRQVGTNLVFSGASGFPNRPYYVIASSDPTLPMALWPVVATNQFDSIGNFTFTRSVDGNTSKRFYSIKMPQ